MKRRTHPHGNYLGSTFLLFMLILTVLPLLTDWITTELRNEVVELFPTREDIDASNGNCRNSAVFAKNASIMFLVGRIFHSHKQLDQ
eukprot:10576042-Ditylum_brightwellii.AAC.1